MDEAGALHVVNQLFLRHRRREIFLQIMREVAGRAVLGMGNLPVKRVGQFQALLVRGLNRFDALDDFLFQLRFAFVLRVNALDWQLLNELREISEVTAAHRRADLLEIIVKQSAVQQTEEIRGRFFGFRLQSDSVTRGKGEFASFIESK